ncbi:ATP-binding protein [Psychromonas sp.]|uniref:HAMP domain-containing sensor histidine kinase n=1 Tax=Psychromonas sp. TaxID=1884585 RepID=UPI0035642A56
MLKTYLFNPSLIRRLFLGYAVIILSLTLVVSVLVSRQITENTLQDIRDSLSIRAQFLAELSKSAFQNPLQDPAAMQQKVVELGRNTQSRLSLIKNDGTVLADSHQSPEKTDNHADRPEIIEARKQGTATSTRFSQTVNQQMTYFAQTVSNEQKTLGFVRVALPLTTVDKKLAQLRIVVLISALISAFVALILGFYFAQRFSAPLIKMTTVADAISKGDYSKRIITRQKDEIGLLAEAFNRMAQNYQLRLSEMETERNRLAMIFTGMVEGVIYVNEQQQIIHINQAAANMLNVSTITCLKQALAEQIKITEIISSVQAAIVQQGVVKTQMQRQADSKETEVIDIYAAALTNVQGESIGSVVVLHDISELAYLERVRRDFVANASHELKTPITVIRGLSETILDDPQMSADIRNRFIENINTQSIRLSSLVSDLMSISRLEANQNASAFAAVDLSNTIKQAINNAASSAEEKKISISRQLPDSETIISADQQEINQLIDNLLSNAIRYTPSPGSVNVNLVRQGDEAIITVKDTGIGISLAHQQRIFERFYRVDKARTRELGGTGLGLSIVKNIAEKHHGRVTLSSTEGHGSTFTVFLPLTNASRPS